MRDLIVVLIVFGSVPMVLARPHIGIYMWSWLGYMNPHRLTWGFAATFPFAMVIAAVTLVGFLFSKEPKRIPWTRETVVLFLFIGWMFITTLYALNPGDAWPHWNKVWKIQLMTLFTMMLMTTKERVQHLIWVVALSLAFYGIKGGIFTILTGGNYRVWGPEGTFIGGNNEIALALLMTVPLLRYLQTTTEKRWQKLGLGVTIFLCIVSIIGSYSRGAFLALAVMGLLLIWKSKQRVLLLMLLGVTLPVALMIMPSQWTERMQSIETYHEDQSAMGRINAWSFAFNLAKDRPLVGGGFSTFTPSLFAIYAPNPDDVHDAHSIYFEVLGEQGFVGLFLFLLLGWYVWRSCGWIRKTTRNDPDVEWMSNLAGMLQTSLIAFAVSGAFLGMAYFDLYYHLVAVIVALKVMLQTHLRAVAPVDAVAKRTRLGGMARQFKTR